MVRNVFRKYLRTFLGVQIDDRDSVFEQPIDPAAEVHGFPHDYGANPELADQAAAIPARSQGRHHDFVPVTPLPARLSKRIRFTMRRRISFLHSSVVTSSQHFSIPLEYRRSNGDTACANPGA